MAEKSVKSLLVIEDNIGDARLIKEILRGTDFEQYELTYVHSLEELEVFKKSHFQAILMDLHLSHVKPTETFKFVNNMYPTTPIIVLTGISDDKLASQIVRQGAQDYVIKGTFDSDSLQRSLKYAIYRKKAEQRLAAEKNRSMRMKKMVETFESESKRLTKINKAKDVFLSIASHQLRTPATSVKQYIGMALEGYGGEVSPKMKPFLETAYQSNDRQLRIVDDLLKVARLDAGHVTLRKEPTNICSLIYDVTKESAEAIAIKKQKLVLHLPEDALMVNLDKDNMRMVFENIMDNATKYSDENTQIEVEVTEDGNSVICTFTDQGIGISPADQKKLFHKFSRIDDSFAYSPNGSGLGLYWARELVKLHHGEIRLTSQKGVGSTFRIRLPL
jgi:signal transduction histidine kinase